MTKFCKSPVKYHLSLPVKGPDEFRRNKHIRSQLSEVFTKLNILSNSQCKGPRMRWETISKCKRTNGSDQRAPCWKHALTLSQHAGSMAVQCIQESAQDVAKRRCHVIAGHIVEGDQCQHDATVPWKRHKLSRFKQRGKGHGIDMSMDFWAKRCHVHNEKDLFEYFAENRSPFPSWSLWDFALLQRWMLCKLLPLCAT